MKYMMVMLLMTSRAAFGMERDSNPLTRTRSYTDELLEKIEAGRKQLEANRLEREAREKVVPKKTRTLLEELQEMSGEKPSTTSEALPTVDQNLPRRETKAHEAQAREAAENIESKRSTDAVSQSKEPEAARLSLKEIQERDAFKTRFKAACLKSNVGKYLNAYIIDQCNARGQGVTNDDIEETVDMFLTAYGDVAFAAIKEAQINIQEDLNKCRGQAGQFAYNFYNPVWQREIRARHHQKLLAEQLLATALDRCDKNTKNAHIKLVLGLIKEHFSHKGHEQGRLLLREAESVYRYGIYKFLHAVHMNPRRVFVALAAAVVIAYGSYRYYHRDY